MKDTDRRLPLDPITVLDEETLAPVNVAGTKPDIVAVVYSATEFPELSTRVTVIPVTVQVEGGLLKFPILRVREKRVELVMDILTETWLARIKQELTVTPVVYYFKVKRQIDAYRST